MRGSIILFIIAGLLTACNLNSGTDRIDNTSEKEIRKQVIVIAENYALSQLKDGEKTVQRDGTIILRDSQRTYVIDPGKIFVGLIDNDANKDAIVSVDTYGNQYPEQTEHLILLKSNGKFMLIRAIESDMKILGIKDRVITAEIHTRSRNSPLYDCAACKEVVKYQFKEGDLIRI
jgi:hypothetical protein